MVLHGSPLTGVPTHSDAVFFLLGLVFLLMIGAIRLIDFVTEPLSHLAKFLDEVNIEDDIPVVLPKFRSEASEIKVVARSFERLLQRLHGYRALNVRRLLIEKRRADIIAASIADGVFLLRGEDLLYMNPVGERILGLQGVGIPWKGLKLGTFLQKGLVQNGKGVQTVLNAVSRTIPQEFVLESEGRKLYYLIQAQSISDELIERVQHSVNGSIEKLLDRWQADTSLIPTICTVPTWH